MHLAAAAGHSGILEEFADVPAVDFESLDPDDRYNEHPVPIPATDGGSTFDKAS